MLDHTDKECAVRQLEREAADTIVYQYGTWLRASPPKPSMKNFTAREKERVWAEKIDVLRKGRSGENVKQSIRLGPVGAARKLLFTPTKDGASAVKPKEREVSLATVLDPSSNKMVLRPKCVVDGGGVLKGGGVTSGGRIDVESLESNMEGHEKVEGIPSNTTGGLYPSRGCWEKPTPRRAMKILSWNVYGIGNPWTERTLRDVCWRERPNKVFLMETKVDSSVTERIKRRCGFENGICLSSVGRSGGMCFWWRELNVEMLSYSIHHFSANIRDGDGTPLWRAMGIYGWPETENKYKTWDLMRNLKQSCDIPYLMFGDFNEIVSMAEKDGGAVRRECLMDAFRDAIDSCALRDLGYKGCIFTWQRGTNVDTVIRERLDRFLGSDEWCSIFPNFVVQHLVRDECGEVVSKAWKDSEGREPHHRIAYCADRLSKWAALSFGEVKKKIKDCEADLQDAQGAQVDAAMLARCEQLADEINELRRLEESYWYARARANEMRDGDKNTAYFHRKASQRKKKNRIGGLFDSDGVWCANEVQIKNIVPKYFESLFSTDNPSQFEAALEGVQHCVTQVMNNAMDEEPDADEIKDALFQMHPNKAPGTDGMHALFFQKFWHIIGSDIVALVKNWWNGLIDISEINRTCIVLIPKCDDLKYMTEFRPISCCNVIYKIISKTLANKIKPFLNDIISINQSAFIPGRLITDNAMAAFEIFHSMKRGGGGRQGNVALKLDMSKAYDRVEWCFLKMVMCKLGFSDGWVHRVMDCISSVSFSFKVNNEICGSVVPTRGLRQGDPISPYLFLLCADAFSGLITKAASEKKISGARVCYAAPRVSHLFFADDSILFAKATLQECSKIADIISIYERASGQKVNLDKTEVAFSKCVTIERRQAIVEALGIREVERHEKYLGLPTIIGKSKKVIFRS
ncbi:uncharacterized protein LOC110681747 [Chenopodium quinoa]|uniref:uncharacterized protein LOC110681747 n=1 Tax=Chenopodium quinoa TaxID=63459 RepID=UPI000B77DC9D|nr:uncharacterized protein LOC110681747 [Chenopodium quinoa]